MTRVGVDVKNFSLHVGGISNFLEALLQHLVVSPPSFQPVCFGPDAAFERVPTGIEVVRVPLHTWLGKARIPYYDQVSLPRAMKRNGIDLSFTPYFDAPAFSGIPRLVMMHDAVHLRHPELYPLAQRLYYVPLMRAQARSARRIIAISKFSRRELVELLGVSPERVRVVYLGAGDGFFKAARTAPDPEVLKRYELPDEFILYSGGVEPRKNLGRLLHAYDAWRLSREGHVPVLVLTGPRDSYQRHETMLRPLREAGRVLFTGVVDSDTMPQLYRAATACVYPSLYEGFGLPVLEALAVGTPVACSDAGPLPEIAGDSALYFDPKDETDIIAALEGITFDQELRERQVERGLVRARRFSQASMVRQLTRAIEEEL